MRNPLIHAAGRATPHTKTLDRSPPLFIMAMAARYSSIAAKYACTRRVGWWGRGMWTRNLTTHDLTHMKAILELANQGTCVRQYVAVTARIASHSPPMHCSNVHPNLDPRSSNQATLNQAHSLALPPGTNQDNAGHICE